MPTRVIKLFAVAALTASTSACAVAAAAPRPSPPPSATPRLAEPIVERVDIQGYVLLTIKAPDKVIKPRVLANYRPACGNTGGKSDSTTDALLRECTPEEIDTAKAQARINEEAQRKRSERANVEHTKLFTAAEAIIRAEPALTARVLINGSPACGNTSGKPKRKPDFCYLQASK